VRGDPHGKMSDRGCVVDRETVALDEWLIVVCCTYYLLLIRGGN
jgi:hypothetical protein